MIKTMTEADWQAWLSKRHPYAWTDEPDPLDADVRAFEAAYENIMLLPGSDKTAAEIVLDRIRARMGRGEEPVDPRPAVLLWAIENGLQPGEDFDILGRWIGFKRPDAAFWYKVAML